MIAAVHVYLALRGFKGLTAGPASEIVRELRVGSATVDFVMPNLFHERKSYSWRLNAPTSSASGAVE